MTEQQLIFHIGSGAPGLALCGVEWTARGYTNGPGSQCPTCVAKFREIRRAANDSPEDALLRRALQARDPLRGRELLPMTMTPEEMRAEADRRTGRPRQE